jgi:hypothetical protein
MGFFSPKVKQEQKKVGGFKKEDKEDNGEEDNGEGNEKEDSEESESHFKNAITIDRVFAMLDVSSDYDLDETLQALNLLSEQGYNIVSSIDNYLILKKGPYFFCP